MFDKLTKSIDVIIACACASALRFTCATTCSRRVLGYVYMSIHTYACAQTYMASVDYTAREREADYATKEHEFSAQERVKTSGAEH